MKVIRAVWKFLLAWGETMDAYRKSQGRNFNRYI
jgi:hypothetical protein